jgi:hypothetical protein
MPDGSIVGAAAVHGLLSDWRRMLHGEVDAAPAAELARDAGPG